LKPVSGSSEPEQEEDSIDQAIRKPSFLEKKEVI
jgi:hypothetical protein